MGNLNLEAIKARDKARTQGEWTWNGQSNCAPAYGGLSTEAAYVIDCSCQNCRGDDGPVDNAADRAFIAACSVDVPALIDEVERLRELASRLKLDNQEVQGANNLLNAAVQERDKCIAALAKALKDCEWHQSTYLVCPSCNCLYPEHAIGCKVATALYEPPVLEAGPEGVPICARCQQPIPCGCHDEE